MRVQPPIGRSVYLGVAKDLGESAPRFSPPEGIVGRAATEEDFPRLVEFMQAPDFRGNRLRLDDLHRRYARGDVCVIGEQRGEIVVLGWVRFDSAAYPLAGIDIPLQRHEAYLGAIFAHPRVRGRGVTTRGALLLYDWLRVRGITTAYGWVQPANRPMVRTMLRLGWGVKAQVTQYFVWAGVRLPVVNIVQVSNPADPLCDWCSMARIRFRCGLRIFRHGPIVLPVAAPQRRVAAGARWGETGAVGDGVAPPRQGFPGS
ncbi:MAG: GNAT family N-acetyltransferase [Armatimonadota bacterium]|nr:GNAT family N-acetyltransferase [Armatimonadota bacterium]